MNGINGKLLFITSCKDSMGSTVLSINTAFLLAKLTKKKVLLIDYDFSCQGEISALLQIKKPCLATDLVSFIERNVSQSMLDGFIPRHPQGIHVLQAFDSANPPQNFTDIQSAKVMDFLMAHFDYVVLDGGASWTPYHRAPLMGAARIWMVLLPEKFLIEKAKSKIGHMVRAFVVRDKIEIVLNRCSRQTTDFKTLETEFSPNRLMELPDSARMGEALAANTPLVLHDVRNPYALALESQVKRSLIDQNLPPYSAEEASHGEAGPFIPFWVPLPSSESHAVTATLLAPPVIAPTDMKWDTLKNRILKLLLKTVDIKDIQIGRHQSGADAAKFKEKTTEAILKIINDLGNEVTASADKRKQLVKEVLNEALGLGPLESLLADKSITEIMINGKDQIYVEKAGKLILSPLHFSSEDQLNAIIERIVAPIGRRVDESTPLVDARLSDGSRVNIIIPPLSLVGSVVTIRRFSETPFQAQDLIRFGSLSEGMAAFLDAAIKAKLNIIVSGGTGSGKTTLLNVLSSFIPEGDRIVTIEDAAELSLNKPHVVSLESRPSNIEGKGEIPIRTLLKNALRMRPDRIVVGECRGGEALDMLQAMNTGHDGSLTTIHSNSPRDCIARLETLVMYSGVPLPSRAIRSQIASAINLIVQLNRISDGSRKITYISELTGVEGEVVTLQDLFVFKQTGVDANRKVIGSHTPTGFMPRFIDTLKQQGIELSRKHFEIQSRA